MGMSGLILNPGWCSFLKDRGTEIEEQRLPVGGDPRGHLGCWLSALAAHWKTQEHLSHTLA